MRLSLAIAIALVYSATVNGATFYANSPSVADVSSAIASASSGDTVVVPAGTNTWASGITLTKDIILTTTNTGTLRTLIQYGAGGANSLIIMNPNGVNLQQVSGFVWDCAGYTAGVGGVVESTGNKWRVCSNIFYNIDVAAFATFAGNTNAVIDHNGFIQRGASANPLLFYGGTPEPNSYGSNAWTLAAVYGGTNCVYAEDNWFAITNGPANGATDASGGAQYVFRHNIVTNGWVAHHGADSGGYRGTFAYEIYNNLMVNTAGSLSWFFEFRSGSGPIFSNTCWVVGGSVNSGIFLRAYRAFQAYSFGGYGQWGNVTGANLYDGNTLGIGYPALDQPGTTGPTTFGISATTQGAQMVYGWTNVFISGGVTNALLITTGGQANGFGGGSEDQLIAGSRDYTNGVVMPSYTPLVYPHPLVGSGGSTVINWTRGIGSMGIGTR